MIIKHPTALYASLLPDSEESGNITYTISNNDPPRSSQTFIQLPPEEEYRRSPDPILTKAEKRDFVGDLYSTISVPGKSFTDTGVLPFEIGQVLDFSTSVSDSADPFQLESVDVIQNNAVVDYDKFGMTSDEVDELVSAAQLKFDELNLEISNVGQSINLNLGRISDIQANINNGTKLYNNIVKVLGQDHLSAKKLADKLALLEAEKTDLLEENIELNEKLEAARSDLLVIKEVVR